jgi:hypothetical protein
MSEADPSSPAGPSRPLLFARVREALGAAATRAVREALIAISHDLERAADEMVDGRERQAMLAAAVQLGRDPIGRAARVSETLAQRALHCLELSRAKAGEGAGLALLAHEALEAQILAGALAAAVREEAGAEYDDYVNRIRRIVAGQWSDDDSNPLGARTLSAAVVAAVAGVAETASVRFALRQSLCRHLTAPIAAAIASADAMLEGEGVSAARDAAEPGGPEWEDNWSDESDATPEPVAEADEGHREIAADVSAGVPADSAPAPMEPMASTATAVSTGPPDVGARAAGSDHDAGVLGTSPLHAHRAPPTGPALKVLQSVAELESDAVSLAHAAGVAPYTREARSEFFGRARTGLSKAGASPAQLAVLDVVGAMFDYVIDDRRMPEPAKPLVWRLQQPAMALALLDPAYLGDEPRSLRRLVEHFGAISVAFSDDLTRGSELYRRLETVVRAVEVVTAALQTRSSVIARQVEREYTRAAEHVGQLIERVARERQSLESAPDRRNRRDYSRRPGPDRERVVTERIRALIDQRIGDIEVPDSAREFLHNVWLRQLRTAALRNGEESSEFRLAMEAIDDLVWSLDHGEGGSRRELAERIPPLIRLMTQGVREIGARDDEYRGFFDELFLIHLRRMQKKRGSAARPTRAGPPTTPAPTPAASPAPTAPSAPTVPVTTQTGPSTRLRRDEAPSPPEQAPESSAASSDRRLLEILSTLDLDDLGDSPQRLALAPAEAYARVARGQWVELDGRGGEPAWLKVAWINQRRTVALLVRRSDRRALSMRMEELKARFDSGRAYLVTPAA